MNCHDIAPLLSAERDGALTTAQRAELGRHLEACADCRALHSALAQAMDALHAEVARVKVPDADEEWRLLQARLAAPEQQRRRRPAPITWIGVPLAAAAAVAFAFFLGRPAPLAENPEFAPTGAELAHADFVEVTDPNATPIVYTDKESGWLVVWAAEGAVAGESAEE